MINISEVLAQKLANETRFRMYRLAKKIKKTYNINV